MCGIVGYIGKRQAAPILMAGLNRLEYRGYDSAGIAIANKGALKIAKRKGRVRELDELKPLRFKGTSGIAHTRWATNGEPSDRNAHPHSDSAGRYAVVHNGIIENAAALRAQLAARGTTFSSDTDTEVIAHLIALMDDGSPLEAVVSAVLKLVVGTYGLAVIDAERPDVLVVARNGSPVVLGLGDKEMLFGSDASAFVRHATSVVHLDDGEIAVVRADGYETRKLDGTSTVKTPSAMVWKDESFDKGAFDHYMRKEIADQPEALRRTLGGTARAALPDHASRRHHALGARASGRAPHQDPGLRCGLYRGHHGRPPDRAAGAHPLPGRAGIGVPLPQSRDRDGHALHRRQPVGRDVRHAGGGAGDQAQGRPRARHRQRRRQHHRARMRPAASICMPGRRSPWSRPRPSPAASWPWRCSPSISAACATCPPPMARACSRRSTPCPIAVAAILAREDEIARLADFFQGAEHAFFVGRAAGYAVAMEGALKLKEISYLHAEAYPASELKHGPLALVTPRDADGDRPAARRSFRQERLDDRGGQGARRTGPRHHASGRRPRPVRPARSRCRARARARSDLLLYIPLQLLAYHVARQRGCDIDKPRNLAKSVTVE